jgi:hypothetical protein
MATFDRTPDGLSIELEGDEASLLERLTDEMQLLLREELSSNDPVSKRLFPDAYDDPEDQAQYRELMGDSLAAGKRARLEKMKESLAARSDDRVVLEGDTVEAWLSTLNDMRLAIGTRLDVTEEVMNEELDPSNPQAGALAVLHWLGWVQEAVLREISNQIEGGR